MSVVQLLPAHAGCAPDVTDGLRFISPPVSRLSRLRCVHRQRPLCATYPRCQKKTSMMVCFERAWGL